MNTLKEHIKSNKFSPVYLLYGEEDYLRKMYRDNLRQGIIGDDLSMNYSYYEGKNIDVTQVIETARTLPFFSERRLIIVENSDFFDSASPLADSLSSFPESTHIIFVQEKVDKRTKLYKQINKIGTVSEFKELSEKNLKIWVATQLKRDNKKITEQTVSYLLDKTGPSMVNLQNEIEKLVCYALDRQVITKEDIDAVCVEQTEGKIFQMIDSITEQDKDTALKYYYDLLELKESPMSILFLLSRHFKILIQVKDLNKLGFNNSEIGKKVGVNPYFVGKYITQARKLTMTRLKHNLDLCNETDADIKRGNQTDQLGVEVLIIQFAS
ncbi:MAG: DNA polymerase III subunit delta [Clostridiales bacterium]|nr:DNA polymerase III subunit delta [Clostridiales bacterium]